MEYISLGAAKNPLSFSLIDRGIYVPSTPIIQGSSHHCFRKQNPQFTDGKK